MCRKLSEVVEQTSVWFSQFRRLRACHEKRADIHEAILSPGCPELLVFPSALSRMWQVGGLPNDLGAKGFREQSTNTNQPIKKGVKRD